MGDRASLRRRVYAALAGAVLVIGALRTVSFLALLDTPARPWLLAARESRLHAAAAFKAAAGTFAPSTAPFVDSVSTPSPTPTRAPVSSVLRPRTPPLASLSGDLSVRIEQLQPDSSRIVESTESAPQHGSSERRVHWRLRNDAVLSTAANKEKDALLMVVVLHSERSWGTERSHRDFFKLLGSFNYAKEKISLTMLVSNLTEFHAIRKTMRGQIKKFAQFSLIFRDDFNGEGVVSRENRHLPHVQRARRRLLARYRNFALLSTLETWHQHVVWLDADVKFVPNGLMAKMVGSGLDIVEPICYKKKREYDLNAWVGVRKTPPDLKNRTDFIPGPLNVKHMSDYRSGRDSFVALDSVGGTMLYVRADIHRQGVLFTHHYVIGSDWDQEGFDGIETEGLCYSAHFFGYKCWGMPYDVIRHVD